ncbi:VOC family protein [Anabaenopsis sp. FSS-46]|uniref:VOC family protein n=1 Tax=Anabaenopsis sp. FSS-46 TaxID=2971766 RepID=UPI002476705C|nr:VOC family protein [Anabaenopsis sp. FSS-46]MDH6100511.1 VOC family protein [Anabaenopsis sp. FSS-46]
MQPSTTAKPSLIGGNLRSIHHIALNVQDMQASRYFYGTILGLHELTGEEVPATLVELVNTGKVANFITPDGTILDLFWTPELSPPDPNPEKTFTRAYHLAFDHKTRPEPMAFRHGDKSIATLVALERLTGFSHSRIMVKGSKNNHLREETS